MPTDREPPHDAPDRGLRERDDLAPEDRNMVGEQENTEDIPQIDPVKGLLDPQDGVNSPAADADAPPPFG